MEMEDINLGPLAPLFKDDSITEVMVNNFKKIFVEKGGKILVTNIRFPDEAAVHTLIHNIATFANREINIQHPYLDAYLPDGSRVNAVLPPMAPSGANLTIRKFRRQPYALADLIKIGSLSEKCAYFIDTCIRARLNIIVSGGTGTGKTTFLNMLSSLIPAEERVITIEDVAELQLQHPNWVRLESVHNTAGKNISTRDCLINALRMRPDRIIVGECRRDETFEMLQAMNTGHEGSMTTIHANTSRDCLGRIESLIVTSSIDYPLAALRKQVVSAVDIIIQLRRQKSGKRVVHEIIELTGMEQNTITTQVIFTREKNQSVQKSVANVNNPEPELLSTGFVPTFAERFAEQGVTIPANFFDPHTKVVLKALEQSH